MMIKKMFSSRISVFLVIVSLVYWIFACSEQPNQPIENAKPAVNHGGHESIEDHLESFTQEEKAIADLIMALKENKMALKESEILLHGAKPAIDSDRSLKMLERELQTAEDLLMDVQKTIEHGDYLKAKRQIRVITDKTHHMNQQIKQVVLKQQNKS